MASPLRHSGKDPVQANDSNIRSYPVTPLRQIPSIDEACHQLGVRCILHHFLRLPWRKACVVLEWRGKTLASLEAVVASAWVVQVHSSLSK